MSKSITERFWSKVDKGGPIPAHAPHLGPCWEWQKSTNPKGYGLFYVGQRMIFAHRFAWESENGPIPSGLVTDHLCRNRPCVNPAHLEPVTNRENILRGDGPSALSARATQCEKGHDLSGTNLGHDRGWRYCKSCRNEYTRDRHRRPTECPECGQMFSYGNLGKHRKRMHSNAVTALLEASK